MCVAKITFPTRNRDRKQFEDLVDLFLTFLMRNGQVDGMETSSAWQKGDLVIYASIPRPDSLHGKYHSPSAKKYLQMVKDFSQSDYTWEILDDPVPRRFPQLKSANSLFLMCLPWGPNESPLRRGNDGRSIPLYLLPVDQYCRQDIWNWNAMHEHFYSLWLNSQKLEIAAWREMADPHSEHCSEGREICRAIEKTTGIPTFLYLERYYGYREGEEDRPCPLCGKNWKIKRPAGRSKYWYDFDFQCMKCRLVSDVGTEKNNRLAKIGDYKA